MAAWLRSRRTWAFCILGAVVLGILSRVVSTGLAIFDKYLGDALYAVMVYGILRLFRGPAVSAICATVLMIAIESFQLTMIPAHMLSSDHLLIRLCAQLIGVQFSILDLLAYAAGIACIYLADSSQS